MSQPTTVHVTYTVQPEQMSTFWDAVRSLHSDLLKEEKLLDFNMFEIQGKPGIVRVVEVWDADVKYMMETQARKEYYKGPQEAVAKISLAAPVIEIMEKKQEFEYQKKDV